MCCNNIPACAKDFLQAARKKGIVVVRSSRVGSGTDNNPDTTYDLIAGDNMVPGKARVLLMLSLMKTNNTKAIQQNFYTC